MLKPLDPITDAKALRRALRAHRRRIFLCQECGYPWMINAPKQPLKCANMACRVGAGSPKRNRPGRPASEAKERRFGS